MLDTCIQPLKFCKNFPAIRRYNLNARSHVSTIRQHWQGSVWSIDPAEACQKTLCKGSNSPNSSPFVAGLLHKLLLNPEVTERERGGGGEGDWWISGVARGRFGFRGVTRP